MVTRSIPGAWCDELVDVVLCRTFGEVTFGDVWLLWFVITWPQFRVTLPFEPFHRVITGAQMGWTKDRQESLGGVVLHAIEKVHLDPRSCLGWCADQTMY